LTGLLANKAFSDYSPLPPYPVAVPFWGYIKYMLIPGLLSSIRRKQNSEWGIEIGVNLIKVDFSKPYAIYGVGLRLVRYGILVPYTFGVSLCVLTKKVILI